MNIKLSKLTLTNFKGIRNLAIHLEGNTEIYAANEVGKSTLYTAYLWLLTGKDEFDRKDYEIKNTKLKELNSQAHEVEGIFTVDGVEVKLKRVYLEKWTKPKGQSTKVFDGHKTEFYYNDVPCNLSEYQAKVDRLIDPKIIKLITNPTYFNSLQWEDQRRGLIRIAGDITNTEVIDAIATAQNDYGTLISVLNGGKTLEEWKKELGSKKSLLKKAAVEYQPRIDELKRSLPAAQDWNALEAEKADVKKEIEGIDVILSDAAQALAEKQKGIMSLQKQQHDKESKLADIRFKIKSDLQAQRNEGANKIAAIKRQIADCEATIARLNKEALNKENNISAYQAQINSKNETIARLRKEWDAINSEKFEFDESKCECPTCKQSLPAHDIEKQKEELRTRFNNSVAQRKADKVTISNQVKAEIKQLEETIDNLNAGRSYEEAIAAENDTINRLMVELQELTAAEAKKQVDNIDVAVEALLKVNADALNLADEIKELSAAIASASTETDNSDEVSVHKSKRERMYIRLSELDNQLAIKATIEKTEARISQLENEEQVNAQAIADLEQQEFEVETFTRAKMDILENRVNSMFKYVQFRLFEKLVNGGIDETCVCEYKEVPYPTLNTAGKLLAGLDVLNTLSKFYNVYAPVFCDNRESTTWIPETKSQIISLFVSPADKKLRVETGELKMALV
jgi:exonuclease SbcC